MDEEVGMGSGGKTLTLFVSSHVNGISEHGDGFKQHLFICLLTENKMYYFGRETKVKKLPTKFIEIQSSLSLSLFFLKREEAGRGAEGESGGENPKLTLHQTQG